MLYGNRIKEIRTHFGESQKTFGERIGVTSVQVSLLESEQRDIKIDLLRLFEDMGINTQWFITGEGEMFRDDNSSINNLIEQSSVIKIPMIDVRASAGQGMVNYVENIKDFISLPENILPAYTNKKNLAIIEIMGDSMEPTIKRDSWVLVRKCNQLTSEGVFIFLHDNELRCKRVFIGMRGQLHIISDNKQYPEEIYTKEDNIVSELTVLAKVICTMNDV